MRRRYAVLRPHLDERKRRLSLGCDAVESGWDQDGCAGDGAHPEIVARGARACRTGAAAGSGTSCGGRAEEAVGFLPGLLARLKALVDPETREDPMSLLVWTRKSTRDLAGALT